MFQFPVVPRRMVSNRVAAHDGGWVPIRESGIEGRLRLPGPIAACRAFVDFRPRHPPCPWYAPSGPRKAWSMMSTWYLYQWNKIRKLLSSAMKMRKRSPLIPLGMQRMNCCALMSFMTWDKICLISSLRIAMRLSRCPGVRGAGCWDGNGSSGGASSGGLRAPDSVFLN